MRTVLVTGAGGFIGRHVVRHLLAARFKVHAADREPFETQQGVEAHAVDLLNEAESAALVSRIRPSDMLHLAWHVLPGEFWTSIENVRHVDASMRLLLAFAGAGGKRWVGVGTCAEYDWNAPGPLDERDTPLRPATLYGAAKLSLHLMSQALAKQVGVSVAWGRIFHLYGPHENPKRLVPSVIRAVVAGKPAPCTHGRQIRDFMHVDDVARALVTVLASAHEGAVNICSGQPVTVGEVACAIGRSAGRPDLVRLGAIAPPPDEPATLAGNAGVLRSLGFRPAYDLESGIAETVRWWTQQQDKDRPE